MVVRFRRLLLSGLLVLIFVFSADSPFSQTGDASPATDTEVRNSLRRLTEIYSNVEQNYAETVNADKAIYSGVIPCMLHVLDPHSYSFHPITSHSISQVIHEQCYAQRHTLLPHT